ncbi:sel1 repeat family protein [Pararhizobium mangrovi]|uniref:Sel1 repeat family protein n=2 Tax=Pararhizobium mangrovi TaxID=2590452 RepID=A0A506TZV8_9HYPH|nr:sel1 repeat family protein [Pararhizobium mangrovi]
MLSGPGANRPGTKKPARPVSDAAKAYGAFQRGYYLTAMQYALGPAQKGKAASQTLLAEIFARGLGVPQNLDDAAFWYGQAAGNGDPAAEFRYALFLMAGKQVKKDVARAQKLMKAAADAGVPAAAFNHAQWLVSQTPGDTGMKEALPYYEKAATAGIPDAQYALSQIYRNVDGLPDAKRAQARTWLQRAAEAGYDTAELDLAIWLVDGIEGPKDYEKGFAWMKRAAVDGNVMAQNRLAHLYRKGIGTRQDRLAAATWYVIARRAGLQDDDLQDFFNGLADAAKKKALEKANAMQGQ